MIFLSRPNRVWVGDITFIPTQAGWLYLAILVDFFARRIVGWAMSRFIDRELVTNALAMALAQRRPALGLVHHTDQGRQYATESYRQRLIAHGISPGMPRKGDCFDNACAESFISTLKNELVHHLQFKTREEAQTAIFEYIEVFYNRQRLHQTLGYLPPAEFEQHVPLSLKSLSMKSGPAQPDRRCFFFTCDKQSLVAPSRHSSGQEGAAAGSSNSY